MKMSRSLNTFGLGAGFALILLGGCSSRPQVETITVVETLVCPVAVPSGTCPECPPEGTILRERLQADKMCREARFKCAAWHTERDASRADCEERIRKFGRL